MIKSARGDAGVSTGRERRRTETTLSLISLARRATASAGLHGFTVEEICDQAGISRRTFFNYFASKEDAVLGIALHTDSADHDAFFVAMRPKTPSGALSANLITDYAALMEARWAEHAMDHIAVGEFVAAAEAEPRLIADMLDRHRADELRDIALVARREGVADDDPRIVALVQVIGHLARITVGESLLPHETLGYGERLAHKLATVAEIFAPPTH